MTFLCDTNIISELARPRPNSGVVDWSQNVTFIAISVITIEEITYGLTAKPNARIQDWFQHFLSYSCQILPVTPEIAQCAGLMRGNFRTKGISRSQADILIAATAEVHDLILVTRNTRDFEGCNIKILNPFVE